MTLAAFALFQESCSSLHPPGASYKASYFSPVKKNELATFALFPKKRARYFWPKWPKNYHAQHFAGTFLQSLAFVVGYFRVGGRPKVPLWPKTRGVAPKTNGYKTPKLAPVA